MIGIVFNFGSEVIETRVQGSFVYFRTPQSSGFATIDELKLDKIGVIKEHPDLKDSNDWQKIARERFKEKIKTMKDENEIVKYLIKELGAIGYTPKYLQRPGHRVVKIK